MKAGGEGLVSHSNNGSLPMNIRFIQNSNQPLTFHQKGSTPSPTSLKASLTGPIMTNMVPKVLPFTRSSLFLD